MGSNTVERSTRPNNLTRKNALFAGSNGGAEHWAVVASLVGTYRPPRGLRLRNHQGHPQSRIDEFLPWAYTA